MPRPRRSPAGHAPGFALPMVILLAMVVGVMAAVMLERQATQGLSTARQMASYREHHTGRGVREVISAWLVSIAGQPVENMIDEDGLVLRIQTPDRAAIRVYMADGQGSMLTDLSALSGTELRVSRDLRAHLEEQGRIDPAWTRAVGPAKISAATAPEGLLQALAFVIAEMKVKANSFAREVRLARADGDLTDAEIGLAMNTAGLDPEHQESLKQMVTAKPDLWLIRVEVDSPERAGTRPRVIARYEGRVQLGGAGAGALGTNMMQSLGSFLSWEERPVE